MQLMLTLRVVVLVIVSTLAMSCSPSAPDTPPKIAAGSVAPAWTGVDLVDGTSRTFPDLLQGSPAVLVFWATWCPYCKVFMPYAGQIQSDYVDQGVQIVTFNAKERGRGDPKAYVQELSFPLVAIGDADAGRRVDDICVSFKKIDSQQAIVVRWLFAWCNAKPFVVRVKVVAVASDGASGRQWCRASV